MCWRSTARRWRRCWPGSPSTGPWPASAWQWTAMERGRRFPPLITSRTRRSSTWSWQAGSTTTAARSTSSWWRPRPRRTPSWPSRPARPTPPSRSWPTPWSRPSPICASCATCKTTWWPRPARATAAATRCIRPTTSASTQPCSRRWPTAWPACWPTTRWTRPAAASAPTSCVSGRSTRSLTTRRPAPWRSPTRSSSARPRTRSARWKRP